MIVIRAPFKIDPSSIEPNLKEYKERCIYQRHAQYSDLPEKADCLSMVLSLINSATGLDIPICWIGNAPYRLIERWNFKIIDTEYFEFGDLLFLSSKRSKYKISHVLIALEKGRFFHCTNREEVNRCEELSIAKVFEYYHQILSKDETMAYRDPRSNSYREAIKLLPS